MLVIRRRPGETVVIGDGVEVEILEASPSQVKLGIRAPKSIAVLRKEIQLTRDQNLQSACEPSSAAMGRLAHALKKPPFLKNGTSSPMRPV